MQLGTAPPSLQPWTASTPVTQGQACFTPAAIAYRSNLPRHRNKRAIMLMAAVKLQLRRL